MQSAGSLEMPVSPGLALLVTFGVWLTMLGDLEDSQVTGVVQAMVLLIVLEVILFTGSQGPGPGSTQVIHIVPSNSSSLPPKHSSSIKGLWVIHVACLLLPVFSCTIIMLHSLAGYVPDTGYGGHHPVTATAAE